MVEKLPKLMSDTKTTDPRSLHDAMQGKYPTKNTKNPYPYVIFKLQEIKEKKGSARGTW